MDSYHGCSVDGCSLCQLSLVKGKPPIIVNACTGGTLENISTLGFLASVNSFTER